MDIDDEDAMLNLAQRVGELRQRLDEHHEYTREHSDRVMMYADLMGAHLGLDEEDLVTLRYGALLHDIGKLETSERILNNKRSVADRILRREAKLSAEDWAKMREHPERGYNALMEALEDEGIAEIALLHHLRKDSYPSPSVLDALGYTLREGDADGLESPYLLTEIVAVADTFDAMTSSRSYQKKGYGEEEALDLLQSERGKKYNPVALDALEHVLEHDHLE